MRSSRLAVQPGGTTAVASYSSTIRGPGCLRPGKAHSRDHRRLAETMSLPEKRGARAVGGCAHGGVSESEPLAPTLVAERDASHDAQRNAFHGLKFSLVPIGAFVLAARRRLAPQAPSARRRA